MYLPPSHLPLEMNPCRAVPNRKRKFVVRVGTNACVPIYVLQNATHLCLHLRSAASKNPIKIVIHTRNNELIHDQQLPSAAIHAYTGAEEVNARWVHRKSFLLLQHTAHLVHLSRIEENLNRWAWAPISFAITNLHRQGLTKWRNDSVID